MIKNSFQNLLSFLNKRQFFLFLFLAYPSLSYAFDSHEHVYLGECIELYYVGDDSSFKGPSRYQAEYNSIKSQRNLVGELCKRSRHSEVYKVKLNSFDFRQHEVLTDRDKFKEYRKKTLWNTINGGSSDHSWTVGEIISIAGDYIGLTISDNPDNNNGKAPAISDPLFRNSGSEPSEDELLERMEDVAMNVLRAFNYLKQWVGNPFFKDKVERISGEDIYLEKWFENLVRRELTQVFKIHADTQNRITFDSSSHRYKYVHDKRVLKQIQDSATGPLPHQNLKLLSANVDHFAPDAQYVYQIGHNLACSFAMSAKRAKQEGKSDQFVNNILSEAYGIEAFVSHYLSDLFSAGHVRAPRRTAKELKNNGDTWSDIVLDVVGNIVHDVDGWLGLEVCNGADCSDVWKSYGDNSLFDIKSQSNRDKAVETLQLGFNQVWSCYKDVTL